MQEECVKKYFLKVPFIYKKFLNNPWLTRISNTVVEKLARAIGEGSEKILEQAEITFICGINISLGLERPEW